MQSEHIPPVPTCAGYLSLTDIQRRFLLLSEQQERDHRVDSRRIHPVWTQSTRDTFRTLKLRLNHTFEHWLLPKNYFPEVNEISHYFSRELLMQARRYDRLSPEQWWKANYSRAPADAEYAYDFLYHSATIVSCFLPVLVPFCMQRLLRTRNVTSSILVWDGVTVSSALCHFR